MLFLPLGLLFYYGLKNELDSCVAFLFTRPHRTLKNEVIYIDCVDTVASPGSHMETKA